LHGLERLLVEKGESQAIEKLLIYGGKEAVTRDGVRVVPWHSV
jgi:hypothetical protein